jgi:hypothetical protein
MQTTKLTGIEKIQCIVMWIIWTGETILFGITSPYNDYGAHEGTRMANTRRGEITRSFDKSCGNITSRNEIHI